MELICRDFQAGDEKAFRELNEAWIVALFRLEDKDREVLNDPAGKILQPGGAIFFAVADGKQVACCALRNEGNGSFELTKMAVSEELRGAGIGRKLLEYSVKRAGELGIPRLFLGTNSSLKNAIHLYESVGFRHMVVEPGFYERADVMMEMLLNR